MDIRITRNFHWFALLTYSVSNMPSVYTPQYAAYYSPYTYYSTMNQYGYPNYGSQQVSSIHPPGTTSSTSGGNVYSTTSTSGGNGYSTTSTSTNNPYSTTPTSASNPYSSTNNSYSTTPVGGS